MYRHPFANPEHLYGYGRADSPDINYYADRRSPTPGLANGPYPYRSFMPMASQSSFFGEHVNMGFPSPNLGPGRGRAASLPEPRSQPRYRYVGELTTTTWSGGIDDAESEPGPARMQSAWKRVLKRMKRRAQRGLEKVRALLHRDDRHSISGFS